MPDGNLSRGVQVRLFGGMSCNKTRTPTIPANRKIPARVSPDKTNLASQISRARISPVRANLANQGSPSQGRANPVSNVRNKGKRMDKDQVKGAGHEVKGGLKETAGKVTGNKSTELEGKVEKNVGTAQRKVGEAKDDIRDRSKD